MVPTSSAMSARAFWPNLQDDGFSLISLETGSRHGHLDRTRGQTGNQVVASSVSRRGTVDSAVHTADGDLRIRDGGATLVRHRTGNGSRVLPECSQRNVESSQSKRTSYTPRISQPAKIAGSLTYTVVLAEISSLPVSAGNLFASERAEANFSFHRKQQACVHSNESVY